VDPVDLASVVLRALGFIALLQAGGIALFLWLFGARLVLSTPDVERLGRTSAWIALPLVLAWQLLAAARLAGDWPGLLDPQMQQFALHGPVFAASLVRVAALLMVALAMRPGTGWRAAGALGATLLAASFLLTGHTAVSPHRLLVAPLLLLHLWVVSFWLGSLLPLSVVAQREPAVVAGLLVAAWSRAAGWLVPCIAIAGALLAWSLLPGWAALYTPYGRLLVGKVAGFAALMGLAAINRWRLGPALLSGDAQVAARMRRVIACEWLVMGAVLAATATMTALYSPEP
jgi:putative copper resistance protein D